MGYQTILDPKYIQTFKRKESFKKTRESMKTTKGGVHCNRYDGHCTKQWVKIPKAIWTSPIIGKKSTCETYFNRAFFMKNDVNDEVPNRNPKILISSNGNMYLINYRLWKSLKVT